MTEETRQIDAYSLKKGSYCIIDGVACIIRENQVSKAGKHGHTKCRIEAIGIVNGQKKIIVVPGHDPITVPIIEKKNAQILSIKGDIANAMDMDTYETLDLKIPDDMKDQVAEGKQVVYWIVLKDKIIKQVK